MKKASESIPDKAGKVGLKRGVYDGLVASDNEILIPNLLNLTKMNTKMYTTDKVPIKYKTFDK